MRFRTFVKAPRLLVTARMTCDENRHHFSAGNV